MSFVSILLHEFDWWTRIAKVQCKLLSFRPFNIPNGNPPEAFVLDAQTLFTTTTFVTIVSRCIMTPKTVMSATGSSGFSVNPVTSGKFTFLAFRISSHSYQCRVHVNCERSEGDAYTWKMLKDNIPEDFCYNCPTCWMKPRTNSKKISKKKAAMKKNLVSGKEPKSFTDSGFPKSKSVYASFSQPDYHMEEKSEIWWKSGFESDS